MRGTILAYVVMVVLQIYGGKMIELLHGAEAAERALDALKTTQTSPFVDGSHHRHIDEFICSQYIPEHYDSNSNILHAFAMILTLWLFIYATTLIFFGFLEVKIFLYLPPLYYLPGWVGRIYFQKDIPPTLFGYGINPRIFLRREFCAVQELFTGNTVRTSQEIIISGVLLVVGIILLFTVGNISPSPKPLKLRAKIA